MLERLWAALSGVRCCPHGRAADARGAARRADSVTQCRCQAWKLSGDERASAHAAASPRPAPVSSRRPPTCNFVTFATCGGRAPSNPGHFLTSAPAARAALRGKRAIRHEEGSTCNKPAAAGSPAVKMKRNSSGPSARGCRPAGPGPPPRANLRGPAGQPAVEVQPARAAWAAHGGGPTPEEPWAARRPGVQPAGRALQAAHRHGPAPLASPA